MILVIDNYDSFTYNLVQYLGELGAEVEVRRNDEVTVGEVERDIQPDRVVVSPGPGTPDEAGVSLELIAALAGHVPVLGVCLVGHTGVLGATGAGRHEHGVGRQVDCLVEGQLVVAVHERLGPQLAQVLDEVVDEAVVVVDDQDPGSHGRRGYRDRRASVTGL